MQFTAQLWRLYLRILGCELIQAAGILLRLPQVGPRRAGPRRGGAIVAGGGGA